MDAALVSLLERLAQLIASGWGSTVVLGWVAYKLYVAVQVERDARVADLKEAGKAASERKETMDRIVGVLDKLETRAGPGRRG
jgi:hypothetical protein